MYVSYAGANVNNNIIHIHVQTAKYKLTWQKKPNPYLSKRWLASTAWMTSQSIATTCSLTAAQSQRCGPQKTTLPTPTTSSTCTPTSWCSTTFASKTKYRVVFLTANKPCVVCSHFAHSKSCSVPQLMCFPFNSKFLWPTKPNPKSNPKAILNPIPNCGIYHTLMIPLTLTPL